MPNQDLMTIQPAPCHVVLMTPAGRGAVASLLVEGAGAAARIDHGFQAVSGCAAASMVQQRIYFGRWRVSDTASEEIVVCRRGAEQFELHCHGGNLAVTAIIAALTAGGCQPLDWPSWVRRQSTDPICAEARIALAHAMTERVGRILLDQHDGLLRQAIRLVAQGVRSARRDATLAQIDDLLHWSRLGLHLTEPWHVVLAGPANVGKSSLINALVGYRRAIVHEQPGTTRDPLSAPTAFRGWPIRLTDTAGLRLAADDVETTGIAQAREKLQQADLTVLVFDATATWTDSESQLTRQYPHALVIHNKCDLVRQRVPSELSGPRTSAITGEGVPQLAERIITMLVPDEPSAGTAIPFLASHVQALCACRQAVVQADWSSARQALQSMLASA
jgi:tRNA modification GTPase